ncbi:MAG: hypothetical protein B1H11_09945 [Desulfobacteraceae bacterium 4484_190.1]|nr:MAG: hypothetical protein B1H11_09945 [Desulfobacteraceae bacterium 4484_190.1]
MGESLACAVALRPEVNDFHVEEIHEFWKEKLAYYKIPQEILVLPELPRNLGDKVNKKQVLE